jgi:hypothetical protein
LFNGSGHDPPAQLYIIVVKSDKGAEYTGALVIGVKKDY